MKSIFLICLASLGSCLATPVTMPNKVVLTDQLKSINLRATIRTQLVDTLAGKTLEPLEIASSVALPLYESIGGPVERTTAENIEQTILTTIFKDHPEAIKYLETLGILKKSQ